MSVKSDDFYFSDEWYANLNPFEHKSWITNSITKIDEVITNASV